MNEKTHYLYKITNLTNQKFYIGVRSTLLAPEDDDYMGSGLLIQQAIKASSREFFKKDILEICESREQLFDREREIVTDDLVKDPMCYNLTVGGRMLVHTEEMSKKMSVALIGNNRTLGMKHTEESKKKIGKASKERIPSAQTKEKMSKARMGREPANKGVPFSDEAKKNVSDGVKRALAEGRGKHFCTEEQRRASSEKQKGRKLSPEQCQKMKDGWAKRRERLLQEQFHAK